MNFEIFGGRKAFAFYVTVVIGTAVEMAKPGGLSETMAMFLVGSAATFAAANAALSWKGMSVQGADEVTLLPPVDLSPLETKLADIQASQAALTNTVTQIGVAASNTNKLLIGALNMGKQG
jgi:hypothetical protein